MKKLHEMGAPDFSHRSPEKKTALQIHDTINQTLFSVLLIAEVLPHIWERDPGEGRARLEELRALTQGAMRDMNALYKEITAEGAHAGIRGAGDQR